MKTSYRCRIISRVPWWQGVVAILFVLGLAPHGVAQPPWWISRSVITGGTADDYAVANLGQLKNFAAAAAAELNANLPGGAGSAINDMIDGWNADLLDSVDTDDYAAINQGQLLNVASLFWARLHTVEYASSSTPWGTDTDDYAVMNLGQLKNLFSFDVTYSTTGTSEDDVVVPDWWAIAAGLDPSDPSVYATLTANPAIVDGEDNRLTYAEAYEQGVLPTDAAGD